MTARSLGEIEAEMGCIVGDLENARHDDATRADNLTLGRAAELVRQAALAVRHVRDRRDLEELRRQTR